MPSVRPLSGSSVLLPGASAVAYDVKVVGQYAYVANGGAGLEVVDVSDPDRLVRIGGHAVEGTAAAVALKGNYAYVADLAWGLQIFDVSNPSNCVPVGRYWAGDATWDVEIAGEYAYLALNQWGFQVLNLSNPTNLVRVGVNTNVSGRGVALVGNVAYVSGGSGQLLTVLDVSNPADPVQLGGCPGTGFARWRTDTRLSPTISMACGW